MYWAQFLPTLHLFVFLPQVSSKLACFFLILLCFHMKRLVTFTLRTLTAVPSYQDIITPSFFTSVLFPPCLHGSCTYEQQPCTTAHWDRSTLLLGSCSQWGGNPCQPQSLRAAAISEKTILYSLCLFNSILCTSKYLHFYLSSNSSFYNELSTS